MFGTHKEDRHNGKRLFLMITALMTSGMVACESEHIVVEKFDPGQTVEGFLYCLPRTELQLKITMTAEKVPAILTDAAHPSASTEPRMTLTAAPAYVGQVTAVAELTPKLVADSEERYVIRGDSLTRDVLLSSNLSYVFDDQGLLLGSDATISDRTGQVIVNLVSTAIELARATRGIESKVRTPADDLQERIDSVYKELATAEGPTLVTEESAVSANTAFPGGETRGIPNQTSNGSRPSPRPQDSNAASLSSSATGRSQQNSATDPHMMLIQDLRTELTLLKETRDEYKADHQVTVTHAITLQPEKFTPQNGYLEARVDVPDLVDAANKQIFYVRIYEDEWKGTPTPSAKPSAPTSINGIVYRPTRSVLTEVLVFTTPADGTQPALVPILSDYISYPQFSPLSCVPIQAKPFGDNVTRLTFSPIGGGLRTVNASATSPAENLTAATAGASAIVATTGTGPSDTHSSKSEDDATHQSSSPKKTSSGTAKSSAARGTGGS